MPRGRPPNRGKAKTVVARKPAKKANKESTPDPPPKAKNVRKTQKPTEDEREESPEASSDDRSPPRSPASSDDSPPPPKKMKKGPIPKSKKGPKAKGGPTIALSNNLNERKKQCRVCGQGPFATADKLKRHMTAHTEKPEAYCQYCNKSIRYAYNMKSHLNNCGNNLTAITDGIGLEKYYPDFMRQCERAGDDFAVQLPSVANFGYRLDRYGYVVGEDPTLRIDLNEVAPEIGNYLGTADDDDEAEDDGNDDGDDSDNGDKDDDDEDDD